MAVSEFGGKKSVPELVPGKTVRRIRYGVVVAHIAALIVPLAIATVFGWISPPEERVTVALYDPSLDNVVDNPSPDPDPSNPVPPSGTPDAGPPAPMPEPEPVPEPPAPDPEPPAPIPEPQINSQLPPVLNAPGVPRLAQPKTRPRLRPRPQPAARKKPAKPAPAPRPSSRSRVDDVRPVDKAVESGSTGRNSGRRGSNTEPGHDAPGGERGNSGYDIQVAMMIERMWITPESVRLGGREPRVLIELRIAPDGEVVYKRIQARSGVLAMDESVSALLANLHRVRAPFDGKPHQLTFWLRARRD